MACEKCKEEFLAAIDERMKVMLDSADTEEDRELMRSHCFHFYELRRAILGQPTVFPMKATISGPLFAGIKP
jgi:hypothetical protein